MALKLRDLYIDIRRELISSGETFPSQTARELLGIASGRTKEQVLADYDLYAPDEVEKKARELLRRRQRGEPLAYMLGEWEFMGLELFVGPGVLIPRIDTEVMAELAVKTAPEFGSCPRVLDLCAGSGCLGLALAANNSGAHVVLADLSPEALEYCGRNISRHKLGSRVSLMEADALKEPPRHMGRFDMILSNPPYIPGGDIKGLDSEVRDFEPKEALDGGRDGLDFYRSIAAKWKNALKKEGLLMFEIGLGQCEEVVEILEINGFMIREIKKDSGGIERTIAANLRF